MTSPLVPLPLDTIRQAFIELGRHVTISLRTQIGDRSRLQHVRRECHRVLGVVNQVRLLRIWYVPRVLSEPLQHSPTIPPGELSVIQSSIAEMLRHLDEAAIASADPPDMPPPMLTEVVHTGQRGRPRVHIDPDVLEAALSLRGPTELAMVFGCAPRTVRRRALEHCLVEPGEPVYVDYTDEDGNTVRLYTTASRDQSGLTDEQLDAITRQILEVFPVFGWRMIDGHLKYLRHCVPRRRLEESYLRVHGPPTGAFGP